MSLVETIRNKLEVRYPQHYGKLVAAARLSTRRSQRDTATYFAATMVVPHECQANPCAYRIEIPEMRDACYGVLEYLPCLASWYVISTLDMLEMLDMPYIHF